MLKKLAGYTAYMFVATSAIRLITFAVSMLGAKIRTKEDFGDYGTYVLLYGLIISATTMGLNQTIQKYSADDEENRQRFTVMLYRGFALLFVVGGLAAIPVGMYWKWSMSLALIGAPWVVMSTLGRFIVRTKLDARIESKLVIVGSITNSGFIFAFLVLTEYKDALIYGDFAALVVTGLVTMFVLPRVTDLKAAAIFTMKIPGAFLRECARFTAPVWGAGAVGTGGHYATGGYTRAALGTGPMGVFNLAEQLWQFAFVPMDLVGQAALPGLVKEKEDRPRLFRELVRLCLIAFPFIAICVAGGMPLLLQVLDLDEKWFEVPNVLLMLVMSVPLRSFQIVANHYTIAEGHARLAFYTAVVYLVAVAIFLYPLTEIYGLYGVVAADILASGCNSVSFAVFMWKGYKNDMKTGMVWAFSSLVVCFVSVLPLYIYKDWTWRWTLALPCGLVYLALLLVVRVVQPSDFARLKQALMERFGRK